MHACCFLLINVSPPVAPPPPSSQDDLNVSAPPTSGKVPNLITPSPRPGPTGTNPSHIQEMSAWGEKSGWGKRFVSLPLSSSPVFTAASVAFPTPKWLTLVPEKSFPLLLISHSACGSATPSLSVRLSVSLSRAHALCLPVPRSLPHALALSPSSLYKRADIELQRRSPERLLPSPDWLKSGIMKGKDHERAFPGIFHPLFTTKLFIIYFPVSVFLWLGANLQRGGCPPICSLSFFLPASWCPSSSLSCSLSFSPFPFPPSPLSL